MISLSNVISTDTPLQTHQERRALVLTHRTHHRETTSLPTKPASSKHGNLLQCFSRRNSSSIETIFASTFWCSSTVKRGYEACPGGSALLRSSSLIRLRPMATFWKQQISFFIDMITITSTEICIARVSLLCSSRQALAYSTSARPSRSRQSRRRGSLTMVLLSILFRFASPLYMRFLSFDSSRRPLRAV
jgi:hypothetical protein